jgi:hypothetical protein
MAIGGFSHLRLTGLGWLQANNGGLTTPYELASHLLVFFLKNISKFFIILIFN